MACAPGGAGARRSHQREAGDARRDEVKARGEEHRDDDDRAEVVHDRQRKQEHAGPLGRFDAVSASPPSANAISVATGIDQARPMPGEPQPTLSAAIPGTPMPPIAAMIGNVACLSFDSSPTTNSRISFQPGDEENDREQAVLGPIAERQIKVEEVRAEFEVPDRPVDIAEWRVHPDQRDGGGHDQDDPAGGAGAQVTAEFRDGCGCWSAGVAHGRFLFFSATLRATAIASPGREFAAISYPADGRTASAIA